ncbi:MAG: 50S ribosomal protein L5 [Planctomycetota bacterium]
MPRLKEKYSSEIREALKERFQISNVNAVPRITKIVVNMGVGKAVENAKRVEAAQREMAVITGQAAMVCKSTKSISNFKLREGVAVGCKVTLRGARMYEFLDRLISVVIPRIRDFRGFSRTGFDGRGNYSLGLTDQVVFPEINIDKVEFVQGMNICFTIANSDDQLSLGLLESFGFPFKSA